MVGDVNNYKQRCSNSNTKIENPYMQQESLITTCDVRQGEELIRDYTFAEWMWAVGNDRGTPERARRNLRRRLQMGDVGVLRLFDEKERAYLQRTGWQSVQL